MRKDEGERDERVLKFTSIAKYLVCQTSFEVDFHRTLDKTFHPPCCCQQDCLHDVDLEGERPPGRLLLPQLKVDGAVRRREAQNR